MVREGEPDEEETTESDESDDSDGYEYCTRNVETSCCRVPQALRADSSAHGSG